ncbi:hypothetical protein EKL29_21175 [Pantoea sp. YU22]|uniref:phage GP46 family protein n=1 Tax=Pantoea sp. YU22 TaxID=2497684 RepID=UPI000F85FD01|nr:phage GP46 family protein [Pantoea sp. YU22]RTY53678.1 hypothetical protein EKL29_21175 [Pantoea sp. YU22]
MILTINGDSVALSSALDRLTRAVLISLFTWRRAESDDETDQPFGWWGDTFPSVANDKIGSRLYLLKRSKLTNATVSQARDYVQQALDWLTEDGVAARVDVSVARTGIDLLEVGIKIYQHDGSIHAVLFDDIWRSLQNG